MFREPIPTEQSLMKAGFRPLQAWVKRLGDALGQPSAEGIERFSTENGFYALDDVACIRIRRR